MEMWNLNSTNAAAPKMYIHQVLDDRSVNYSLTFEEKHDAVLCSASMKDVGISTVATFSATVALI